MTNNISEESRELLDQPGPVKSANRQTSVVTAVVFVAFLGQMTLNPIIAPLARAIGLEPWQIGVTISAAAMMLVVTSQWWGRASQSRGHKAVLASALGLAFVTMALFAVVAGAGMVGLLSGIVLFVLVLLLRGIGYGAAVAAVLPTAQSFIADVADTESERVKGMAGIGAAQAAASIVGALLGGGLAVFGLAVPLAVIPVLLLAAWILVRVGLSEPSKDHLVARPKPVRPTDPRVWPFLLAGFGLFTGFGFVQIVIGFVIQDRFALDTTQAAIATGGALLAAGIGMILAQVVFVPRLGWGAARLIGSGAAIAGLGFALAIPSWGLAVIMTAIGLVGAGIGLAIPGYTAGPMRFLDRDEQGSLAGLIGSTNGLTFVVAPALSTVLYQVWGPLPLIIAAGLMVGVLVVVVASRGIRQSPVSDQQPVTGQDQGQ